MTEGKALLLQVAEHAKVARARGFVFYLARRTGPDAEWERMGEDTDDLLSVFASAMRMSRAGAGDIGVVCDREGIGIVYWNSKRPDLLNDAALAPA